MTLSISFSSLLEDLLQGLDLDENQAQLVMQSWLNEDFSSVQTGALLAALRVKGVSGQELSGMAKVLKEACKIPCSIPGFEMVDNCGTGGDGANTFNISTAVSFVSAACGVKVAKHGNRSASGKVGSADVLEGLGINLMSPLEKVVQSIEETNITFLFAPAWHSSLIKLAPLRKSLGVRTIFNLLGPLVNPLRPTSQVLGVATPDLLDPMSEALKLLGLKRAIVVYGAGGLDEASLEGPNQLRFLEDGVIKSEVVNASDLGLSYASNEDLKGDTLEINSRILSSLLKGEGCKPHREVVALNTALVLWVSGLETNLGLGINRSLNCLESGAAWNTFNQLKNFLES